MAFLLGFVCFLPGLRCDRLAYRGFNDGASEEVNIGWVFLRLGFWFLLWHASSCHSLNRLSRERRFKLYQYRDQPEIDNFSA